MKRFIQSIIFYPAIFSIIPILSLYLGNLEFVPFSEFILILLITYLMLTPIWLITYKSTGSIQKSGLLVTIFILLFFSFGSFISAISDIAYMIGADIRIQLLNNIGWKLNLQLGIWIFVFVIFFILIKRIRSELILITSFMNFTSIILLLLVLFRYSTSLQTAIVPKITTESIVNDSRLQLDSNLEINEFSENELPNIYFIVLDGYGRSDKLRKFYNYDNSGIEEFLTSKGFYIADRSRSNYLQTYLSLTSNLNLNYIDNFVEDMDPKSNNINPILDRFQNNQVIEFLNHFGYEIIAFESGYSVTELNNVDQFYSGTSTFSQFTNEVINLTPLQLWLDDLQNETHRMRIQYTFSQLPIIINSLQPTFVFAHILAPHPPFVFGANGESINQDKVFTLNENKIIDNTNESEYKILYADQLHYINSLTEKTVDQILLNTPRKSIIIIQGDHGPRSMWDWNSMENTNIEEVFPIFNAIFLPDQDYSNLYEDISSVNTFRVIFDQYFGTDLGVLDDKSFYHNVATPYDYIEVPESKINQ